MLAPVCVGEVSLIAGFCDLRSEVGRVGVFLMGIPSLVLLTDLTVGLDSHKGASFLCSEGFGAVAVVLPLFCSLCCCAASVCWTGLLYPVADLVIMQNFLRVSVKASPDLVGVAG